jgi:hypothetical protein
MILKIKLNKIYCECNFYSVKDAKHYIDKVLKKHSEFVSCELYDKNKIILTGGKNVKD